MAQHHQQQEEEQDLQHAAPAGDQPTTHARVGTRRPRAARTYRGYETSYALSRVWDGKTQTGADHDVTFQGSMDTEDQTMMTVRTLRGGTTRRTFLTKSIRGRGGSQGASSFRSSAAVACILALCVALSVVHFDKIAKPLKAPGVGRPWPFDFTPSDLSKLAAAAESLDALLGDSAVEEVAVEISFRLQELEKTYSTIQREAELPQGAEWVPYHLLSDDAKERLDEEAKALLEAASRLLAHAAPGIQRFPEECSRKAVNLREGAKVAQALAKIAPHDFTKARSALMERFAVDALRIKSEAQVLFNSTEKAMKVPLTDLRQASETLQRTVSLVARMARVAWRITKDEDVANKWSEEEAELLRTVGRVQGRHLRIRLEAVSRSVSMEALNSAAGAAAAKSGARLQTIHQLVQDAPSARDLEAETDPVALLELVKKLKAAEQQAIVEAEILTGEMELEMSNQGVPVDADLYEDSEKVRTLFKGEVKLYALMAKRHAEIAREAVEMPIRGAAGSHEEARQAAARAQQSLEVALSKADEAEAAAAAAGEATTLASVLDQLGEVRRLEEQTAHAAGDVSRHKLMQAAWEHVTETGKEAMRELSDAVKAAEAEEDDDDTFAKQCMALEMLGRASFEILTRSSIMPVATKQALRLRNNLKEI